MEGISPYTILLVLPCLVENSDESKNSKLELDLPVHAEGVYDKTGRTNIFHLKIINQAVKPLHIQTSFVDLHFVLLPYKCEGQAFLP